MKKTLLSSAFIFLIGFMEAQNINLGWVKQIAGPAAAQPRGVCYDGSMNSIMVGSFEGVSDFDPSAGSATLSSNGSKDAFIAKYDAQGNYQWAVSLGASQDDIIYNAVTDNAGNVYAVGEFRGSVDFDPGSGNNTLTAFTGYNGFLIKLNSSGQFQWVVKIAGSGQETATVITKDANDQIIIGGKFYGNTDFANGASNGILNFSYYGLFLAKYTSSGTFVWVRGYDGYYTEPKSIKTDAANNILMTGTFYSTVDFDPGAASFTLSGAYYDTFITKLDANGIFSWAKSFGGTSSCIANDMALDSQGNIYLTGFYNAISDFDPDLVNVYNLPYSGSGNRAFMSKLTSAGLFIWAKSIAQQAVSESRAVEIDNTGAIYISGIFYGSADFNPDAPEFPMTSPSTYYNAAFLSKFDASGVFITAFNFGGSTGETLLNGVAINPANGAFTMVGNFTYQCVINSTSGAVTLNSAGSSDIYLARFVQCAPSTATVNASACNSYTLNGFTYTNSGSYTQTLVNVLGCDSTITLNLTIQGAETSQVTYYTTEPVTINGQTYSNAGSYTQQFLNASGCDSIVNYNIIFLQTTFSVTNNNGTLTSPQAGNSYQWIDCSTNQSIPGATSSTFVPTVSGSYAVIVFGNTGSVTSQCITVTISSVDEVSEQLLGIWPNPASDEFNLVLKGSWHAASLQVRDITGRLIHAQNVYGGQLVTVPCVNWSPGIYEVVVFNGSEQMQAKLVKH